MCTHLHTYQAHDCVHSSITQITTFIHTSVYVYVSSHVVHPHATHANTQTHTCAHTHVHTHMYTHSRTHTHHPTHTHTHTHTHTPPHQDEVQQEIHDQDDLSISEISQVSLPLVLIVYKNGSTFIMITYVGNVYPCLTHIHTCMQTQYVHSDTHTYTHMSTHPHICTYKHTRVSVTRIHSASLKHLR